MNSNNHAYDATRDPLSVWNGNRFVFTLRKIRELTNGQFQYDESFSDKEDLPISILDYEVSDEKAPSGTLHVVFLVEYSNARARLYAKKAAEGVLIVSPFKLESENGEQLSYILFQPIKKLREIWCEIGAYAKHVFPMPTISITGSIGKTTTTRLVKSVFSQSHRVFSSGRNRNTSPSIIQQIVKKYGPEYDFHIQEVGGGGPTVVERSANVLQSDAFVVTNVHPHHLDYYKTIDGVLYDKTSFERVADHDIIALVNLDDEQLLHHDFACRRITFAITNQEADYVAKNIEQEGSWLTFDAYVTATQETIPLRISIPGKHNAYNGLVAFALAREFGISDEDVIAGLAAYRSRGIRQVTRSVAGRTLYMDCFNCSAESIRSCLASLDLIEVPDGGRRIAALGGEGGLGEQSYDINFNTGRSLGEFGADEYIFVGPEPSSDIAEFNEKGHGYAEYEGAKQAITNKPVSFYSSLRELATKLANDTKPGDAILFKASYHLPLYAAVDRAFGTCYLHYDGNHSPVKLAEGHSHIWYHPETDGSNLMTYYPVEDSITIPATVAGKPLTRIGKRVFKNRSNIKELHIEEGITTIGAEAFAGCTGLTELELPSSLLFIEENAFAGCTNLKHVVCHGKPHVSCHAFFDCPSIEWIYFPNDCTEIEPKAFSKCAKIIVFAPKGSYTERVMRSRKIRFSSGEPTNLKLAKKKLGKLYRSVKRTGSRALHKIRPNSE